jgi:hypothetical protein
MIAHVGKAFSSMTVVSLSTKDRHGGLFFENGNLFKLLIQLIPLITYSFLAYRPLVRQ